MKVGDTFRVFEVVKPMFEDDFYLTSKQSCEIKANLSDTLFTHLIIDKLLWDIKKELKQVGIIRIKSLKNGK